MAFSSLLFLTLFLPVYVIGYLLAPHRARNGVLLALSLAFYAWGAPSFLPVILALGIVDFTIAYQLASGRPRRRALLAIAVTGHLSILAYFKYSNFIVGELNRFVAVPSGHPLAWTAVALPIGISFLTFEEISYVCDVYRGDARPARSVPRYVLFLMLFPHSIAGPIFRWKDLEHQLGERRISAEGVSQGLSRFAWGLAKKILVADAAAITADSVFAFQPDQLTRGNAWLGAFAYTIQIYYDFSGYSDMAIGLGKIAGFTFKENFDAPYISTSITEFWTRWHISLSSWLRDYLYIPLGGNRRGETRTRFNVLVVFLLSGLWHGANWTFVLWGGYHGLFTILERTHLGRAWRRSAPRWLAGPVTFLVVVVGWVFFRASDFAQVRSFLHAMFLGGATEITFGPLPAEILPRRSATFLLLGLALVLVRASGRSLRTDSRLAIGLSPLVFVLALLQVVNTKFVPLIYFRF